MGEVVNITDPAELENKEILGIENLLKYLLQLFNNLI